MAVYAMTGGATGIGAAIKQQILEQGHKLVVVDLKDADVIADLSTQAGREDAVAAVIDQTPDGLDGFIACAGLGPAAPAALITKVNYFGAQATIEGLKEHVAKKGGKVILIASNSGAMPGCDQAQIDAMLDGDEEKASTLAEAGHGQVSYMSSKRAITQWMRRNTVPYARLGLKMNAVAPGFVQTPLSDAALADPALKESMQQFSQSIPVGRTGIPDDIANTVSFLLSDKADFIHGSVLFVDGGSDAMIRSDAF